MSGAYMPPAGTTEWATPQHLFDELWDEFDGFDLDPCGQRELHYTAWKITHHGGAAYDGSTEALDGLVQPWIGKVYMNPPYGRGVEKWVEKAVREVRSGNAELVVALLKATTDVKWWQAWVLNHVQRLEPTVSSALRTHMVTGEADAVRFLPGRLKFGGQTGPAPFPSVIVVWTGATLPLAQPGAAPEQGRLRE